MLLMVWHVLICFGSSHSNVSPDDPRSTVSIRNLSLDHTDSRPFEGNYISRMIRFDTKASFLGSTSQVDMIRAAGRMSRLLDPRRPKKLTERQKASIRHCTEIQDLKSRRHQYRHVWHSARSMGRATEADLYHTKYQDEKKTIEGAAKRLRQELLTQVQAEYDKYAPGRDIMRQLSGEDEQKDASILTSISVGFAFEERYRIAEALLNPPLQLGLTSDVPWQSMIIEQMVSLCSREEGCWRRVPHKRQTRETLQLNAEIEAGQTASPSGADALNDDLSSLQRSPFECLHCLGNPAKSLCERTSPFKSKASLQRHYQRKHPFVTGSCCPFPHLRCATMALQSEMEFKSHAASVHRISL